MPTRLTPFGKFVKWIVIPIALALTGYFVIGPRIGKSAAPASVPDRPATQSAPPIQTASAPSPGSGTQPSAGHVASMGSPDVTVGVRPILDQPVRPRRHRHRKPPPPDNPQGAPQDADAGGKIPSTPPPTPPTTTTGDTGGSGGATTAGN